MTAKVTCPDRQVEVTMTLLLLMLACAGGAIFLIGAEVFSDFRDMWVHPDHKMGEEKSGWRKPKSR